MVLLCLFYLILYVSVYDYIKLHWLVCLMTGKVLLKRAQICPDSFAIAPKSLIIWQPRLSEQRELMVKFSLYNLYRLNIFFAFCYSLVLLGMPWPYYQPRTPDSSYHVMTVEYQYYWLITSTNTIWVPLAAHLKAWFLGIKLNTHLEAVSTSGKVQTTFIPFIVLLTFHGRHFTCTMTER